MRFDRAANVEEDNESRALRGADHHMPDIEGTGRWVSLGKGGMLPVRRYKYTKMGGNGKLSHRENNECKS